ncbi:MAG: acyltransferase [Actinomycetia bacterium]|nr:acyltransferase [Actinomycetes bacterium]
MMDGMDIAAAPVSKAAYQRFRATRHFGSLDALRALAIIAVVWHHTGGQDTTLPIIGQRGYLGVELFFVISGFLITTLLLREEADHGTVSLRNFYARRSLRIFPLYYAVLAIYSLLVLVAESDQAAKGEFFSNLPAFMTYTGNWFIDPDSSRIIFAFSWSLAAEEQFYLVWPMIRRYTSSAVADVIGVLGLGGVVAASLFLWSGDVALASLPERVLRSISLAICSGVVLAILLNRRRAFESIHRVLGQPLAAPLAAAATILVLVAPASTHLIQTLAFTVLLGTTVCREDHGLQGLSGVPGLGLIGKLSYGIYLFHMIVVNVVERAMGEAMAGYTAVLFLTTLAATIGVASLSWRYFESPILAHKKRWDRKPPVTADLPA